MDPPHRPLPKSSRVKITTRAKFIELWAKLTGSFAPTDLNVAGAAIVGKAEPAPDLGQLTDEELRTWIKLREKACAGANDR